MRAPAFSTWTPEHRKAILQDRQAGVTIRDLERKHHHASGTLQAFLRSEGKATTPCALRQLAKPDNKPKYMPDSWIPSDCISLAEKQRVLCDFRPVLTVSIKDGVLLNRLDEVLSRRRGGIGGRW